MKEKLLKNENELDISVPSGDATKAVDDRNMKFV